jgi:dTDP-4-amino-4,6-dideoxygalactose transaminase
VHYPSSIPRQAAVAAESPASCAEADRACGEVLSLPLHPALADGDVDDIVKELTCVR